MCEGSVTWRVPDWGYTKEEEMYYGFGTIGAILLILLLLMILL